MSRIRLESGSRAVLSGCLNLDSLMAYRQSVEDELPVETDLTVDLSALDATDSAVLALLVFLVRRSRAAGSRLVFEGINERILAMADLAGIEELVKSAPPA